MEDKPLVIGGRYTREPDYRGCYDPKHIDNFSDWQTLPHRSDRVDLFITKSKRSKRRVEFEGTIYDENGEGSCKGWRKGNEVFNEIY